MVLVTKLLIYYFRIVITNIQPQTAVVNSLSRENTNHFVYFNTMVLKKQDNRSAYLDLLSC